MWVNQRPAILKNEKKLWAVILGGSSGIGLAAAKKLAKEGMNICVVHRDRRSTLESAIPEFEKIKENGVSFKSFNTNALESNGQLEVLNDLKRIMNGDKVKVLVHAISRGNLKGLVEKKEIGVNDDTSENSEVTQHFKRINELMTSYSANLGVLTREDIDLSIYAMGTSLLDWTQGLIERSLFADSGRIIGLTSEGNKRIWESYSAIAIAKSALETLIKYLAIELAPYNITANVIQAGITDTASFRMIPGNELVKSSTIVRNPYKRLTHAEDIANFIYLMCQDEANWVNGAIIPVDGGEHLQ